MGGRAKAITAIDLPIGVGIDLADKSFCRPGSREPRRGSVRQAWRPIPLRVGSNRDQCSAARLSSSLMMTSFWESLMVIAEHGQIVAFGRPR